MTTDGRRAVSAVDAIVGGLIGPGFLALAAWLLFGPALTRVPSGGTTAVPADALRTTPRRTIVGDPPRITINNFERQCSDCHGIFDVNDKTPGASLQHQHIVLDHGINDQCRNCHNYDDMNQLVLYNGAPIPYRDVPQLCQKCHGPVFLDWERGIHGRVNDYWDAQRGPPRRLKCIQCHDPHRPRHPAMDPLLPLPGPNTLRMGASPAAEDRHTGTERDPLRTAVHREHVPNDGHATSSIDQHDGEHQ